VASLFTEIRWHGRAGQGVVTVSRLLAEAALREGKYVQAFPEFGPERTGSPVQGFTRISDDPIEIHTQIYNPDAIAVIDPSLLDRPEILSGLKEAGKVIVNTDRNTSELRARLGVKRGEVYTLNATMIALDIFGQPFFNTPMLAAVVKATQAVSLESVLSVIKERFAGSVAEKNVQALKRGFEEVVGG